MFSVQISKETAAESQVLAVSQQYMAGLYVMSHGVSAQMAWPVDHDVIHVVGARLQGIGEVGEPRGRGAI